MARTRRVVRLNSCVPSRRSSALTCSDTVERGKPRLSAARVKLFTSLTRTKVRSNSNLFTPALDYPVEANSISIFAGFNTRQPTNNL